MVVVVIVLCGCGGVVIVLCGCGGDCIVWLWW